MPQMNQKNMFDEFVGRLRMGRVKLHLWEMRLKLWSRDRTEGGASDEDGGIMTQGNLSGAVNGAADHCAVGARGERSHGCDEGG